MNPDSDSPSLPPSTALQQLADLAQAQGRYHLPWQAGSGAQHRPITLHGYRPPGLPADAPLVLVQHGVLRNGHEYRDFWLPAAQHYGLHILAPTFGTDHWPGVECYNNGSVIPASGMGITPKTLWSYQLIPALLDALRATGLLHRQPVYLFGHSAGGQFVHRLVSLLGAAPFAGVACGNPGWYTLPDEHRPFPEGLAGIGLPQDALARLLGTPLVILAGDRDTDTQAPYLPAEPEALRQGPHRFARAQHYYACAQAAAQRLGLPLAWQLHNVAGIGHDGEAMSHVCAHLWFEGRMPDTAWLSAWAGRQAA